jgi:LRR receptor-like serine/threonine-protein kinase FLS2
MATLLQLLLRNHSKSEHNDWCCICIRVSSSGHSTPVVHCDLKPSNVLIHEDMVAHVCDFGIAKLLGGSESIVQTKTLSSIGYMAPGDYSS